jgi:TetR/AcrR family transcriptional repressor of nem operon
MRVSREQVAENREKILKAASRLFRARGFEAVTVAEIMNAADLTHGGFYGYFKSKDDLIAQALSHALAVNLANEIEPARFVAAYLSAGHRDNLVDGCTTASLAAETLRAGPEARAAMTEGLRQQLDRFTRNASGATSAERRKNAIGKWSAMVGALILARLSDDPQLSDEILEQTRKWIGDRKPANASRRTTHR